MTDLRKIAESLKAIQRQPTQDEMNCSRGLMFATEERQSLALSAPETIVALLDAVVEERAKVIHAYEVNSVFRSWKVMPDKVGDVIGPAREKYRKLALRELNLEGVWPAKEG